MATAERRWSEAGGDLASASEAAAATDTLHGLDEASDESCASLRAVEGCLIALPEGPARAEILAARAETESAVQRWSEARCAEPLPAALSVRLRKLSEEALDTQRELALERRRLRARPEDHDAGQLQWLGDGLADAERDLPGGWRVLYLHHPLYSTIANHCEHPDVRGVRENLIPLIRDRVHLVLAGHAHAFEWLRSEALPHTGLFVTGGGGQVSLRRSLLAPGLLHRHRERYAALREAGVTECAVAGRGPAADDGEEGPLYHYLRIEVTPEVLRVCPVGVRRLERGYRREAPIPLFHAPELPEPRPPWHPRRLEAVEIRRGEPPRPVWA